jgi:hypothetical protein
MILKFKAINFIKPTLFSILEWFFLTDKQDETHLHESGTDLRFIQGLLDHKSSITNEIYTFVSTLSLNWIKSPFDDLRIEDN